MAKEEDIKMEDADGDDGLPKGQDITMEEELDEQSVTLLYCDGGPITDIRV